MFLMSAGVEVESIIHEKYNVREQIEEFVHNKGTVLACGTCIKSRNLKESDVCPISTMIDCVTMIEWADKTVTI